MNLGDKLCLLRTQHGYSQEQLAELVGVSRQSVSKWESGVSLPETEKLIQVSDLFDVSIDFLMRDEHVNRSKDDLDRVIFKFLGSVQEMDDISHELISIMQDGVIDEAEKVKMGTIIKTLDDLSKIIDEIKMRIDIKK